MERFKFRDSSDMTQCASIVKMYGRAVLRTESLFFESVISSVLEGFAKFGTISIVRLVGKFAAHCALTTRQQEP